MPENSSISAEDESALLSRLKAAPASATHCDVIKLFNIVSNMPGVLANIWDNSRVAAEIHKWSEPFAPENTYTDIQYRNELSTQSVQVLSLVWGQSRTGILMYTARTDVIKKAARSLHPPLAIEAQAFLKRLESRQIIPPASCSLFSQFAHSIHRQYLARAHG